MTDIAAVQPARGSQTYPFPGVTHTAPGNCIPAAHCKSPLEATTNEGAVLHKRCIGNE